MKGKGKEAKAAAAPDLGFTEEGFEFLEGLEANNDRDWFNANKAVFKRDLEGPFGRLLEALTAELAGAEVPLSGGPKTAFRMNRDVRFSADKRPYKTAVSGMLTPTGEKVEDGPVLYAQIDAKGGMVACGYYKLTPARLKPFREKLAADPEAFFDVVAEMKSAGAELSFEESLSSMPKGFSQYADHEAADYLKLTSLICSRELTRSAWLDGSVVGRAAGLARACMPLIRFVGA